MSHPATVTLFGLPFVSRGIEVVKKEITAHLTEGAPLTVFTPNAEILTKALHDKAAFQLLRRADLLLPDGIGVLLLSRRQRTPIQERIPGIELGEWLLSYAAEHRLPVYLLGGAEGVAKRAAEKLQRRFPALVITGTHHGYPSPEEEEALLRSLEKAAPRILLVCMGFPKQERWILAHRDRIPSAVALGLGGALDVWSGDFRRAPKTVQRLGAEWLWRILQSPRRLLRLRFLFPFGRLFLLPKKPSALSRRKDKRGAQDP